MPHCQIGDQKLYFEHYKKENPVGKFLILHGRGGSSQSRETVAKLLNKLGYEVLVPDLPGFGQTEMKKAFTVQDYAEFVKQFIEEQKLEDFYLLGHSNGGRISIKLTELLYNKKIKKLFLNNAAGIKNPPSSKQKISKLVAKIMKKLSWMPGYSFLRKILYKLVGGHDYLNVQNENIKQSFLNMINSDLSQEMQKIQVPTVLIRGEKDSYTPLADGKKMHKLIAESEMEILDGEKHGIHLQNPDRLFQTIQKYLD